MPLEFNPRPQPANAEQIAQSLRIQAKSIYNNMVNTFNRGSKMFWSSPSATPAEIAAALGDDGKQLFELHYKLGQLISTVNPMDIAPGSTVIGQFTMNENGTVTVLPPSGNP
jgi:hypothetical protein